MRECTIRGFVLGAIFALLFTAANAYLGLKVGLTFATSIPAAVISMAVLRAFKDSSILENNIVQTIASVGGTISAIVFVLPAIVILGFWKGFPFWQTFFLAAIGGILGVLFAIPLRRALVVDSDLPYPEGTAAAETLKVGCDRHKDEEEVIGHPLRDITFGGICSFVFNLFASGFNLFATGASYYGKFGGLISGLGFQYSFALLGAGYLIGLRVGIAILIGSIISWGIAVPLLSLHHTVSAANASDFALNIWANNVRFIGAGTMGIGAIWATIKLVKPIFRAVLASIETSRKRRNNEVAAIATHERDIPIIWVLAGTILLALPLMAVFAYFVSAAHFSSTSGFIITLVVMCVFLVIVVGFLTAAVSGYMAGLLGSSNSPLSGIGMLAIMIVSLFLSYLFSQSVGEHLSAQTLHFMVALAIVVTSAVLCSAGISNDNLQDLKTGHLVGATPWKQQVSLIFGILIGAAVLAPVLNQLYQAYGFVGAMPHTGMDAKLAMNAPQATLMAAIAKGIITHHMNWEMLSIGVLVGAVFLLLNALLSLGGIERISVLSIGFGIYLPPEINIPLIAGGVITWIVKRNIINRAGKYGKVLERGAILLACGWIVGESLFGIFNALLVGATGDSTPIALVGSQFAHAAFILGTVVFIIIALSFYYYMKASQKRLIRQHDE